jgi:hypothetical protein
MQLQFLEDQEDLVGPAVLKDQAGLSLLEDLVARGLLMALLVQVNLVVHKGLLDHSADG